MWFSRKSPVHKAMLKKGMDVETLAKKAKVKPVTIQKYIDDKKKLPSKNTLNKLEKVLGKGSISGVTKE
tara:strand:- start:5277 stop:5483 length:207 start_codon:yes stop_codon:yes gene_type:complete